MSPGPAKPGKQRLDTALVERGLVESRARAQALIIAGRVFSGERRLDKPGQAVAPGQPLELRGQDHPWVSRGGLKLVHALVPRLPGGRRYRIVLMRRDWTEVLASQRQMLVRRGKPCRARSDHSDPLPGPLRGRLREQHPLAEGRVDS